MLNTLGIGLLEKVHENRLVHEIRKRGLTVEQQRAVSIRYDGVIVEDRLIVALKVAMPFEEAHTAQCLTYLKATGLPFGPLRNFGKARREIKRMPNGV